MKIEDIPKPVLGAVRQRLGAANENDTSFDTDISKLTPKELMMKWSGWHLGYSAEYWAETIIRRYEQLKQLQQVKS